MHTRVTVAVSRVRCPYVVRNSGFGGTAGWNQTKFYGKLPIRPIAILFFFFFNLHLQTFTDRRTDKRLLLPKFSSNSTKPYRKHPYVFEENTGYYFFVYLPNFKYRWHFEDKLPQLYCKHPKIYACFICHNVKQSVKVPLVVEGDPGHKGMELFYS